MFENSEQWGSPWKSWWWLRHKLREFLFHTIAKRLDGCRNGVQVADGRIVRQVGERTIPPKVPPAEDSPGLLLHWLRVASDRVDLFSFISGSNERIFTIAAAITYIFIFSYLIW